MFPTKNIPSKYAESIKFDAKRLGKKLCLRPEDWRTGINLIIAIFKKEIENLTFSVKDRFLFHSSTPKAVFSSHSWKYCFCCSFGEIKIDLTQKHSNILYILNHLERFTDSLPINMLNEIQRGSNTCKVLIIKLELEPWQLSGLRVGLLIWQSQV